MVVIFVHALTDHILCCGHINNLGYGTQKYYGRKGNTVLTGTCTLQS